jgi:hypothetical protein
MGVIRFYILLFGVVYHCWCDFALDPTVSTKFYENHGKCATLTMTMRRKAFGKECMSRKWMFNRKIPKSSRPKEAIQVKSNFKSMSIVFDIERTVHNEFVLASQKLRSICYHEILRRPRKNLRLRSNFGNKRAGLYMTTTHCFSSRNFSTKTTWLSSPQSPDLALCDFSLWRYRHLTQLRR